MQIKEPVAYATQRQLFALANTDVAGFHVIGCADDRCTVIADVTAPSDVAARPQHYHVGRDGMQTITTITCSECGRGDYARDEHDDIATCGQCEHAVSLSRDIAPNLDDGERLAWVDRFGVLLLAVIPTGDDQ